MSRRPVSVVTASLVLLVISVGLNAFQAKRIHSLLDVGSSVGRAAPTVSGRDPAGRPVTIDPAAGLPTLFYFFDPTCHWCERNWGNVRAISREHGGRYRVVGLSDATIDQAYVAKRALDMPIVGQVDARVRMAFGFRGTPHSVLVSADGIITHDWAGAYVDSLRRRIEEAFQLTLPGLAELTK